MDRERMMRESERAAIERWFPQSPLGPMFDPGDGGLVPMPADAAPAWKDEAFAIVDRFLAGSSMEAWIYGIALTALLAILYALAPMTGYGTGTVLAAGTTFGMILLHGWSVWRLRRFRAELAALRQRIRTSLAGRTPLPAELAQRYRRFNRWRVALHVWVGALALVLLACQHFIAPDEFPPAAVLGGLVAVGIAWLLYFAARRVDLQQG